MYIQSTKVSQFHALLKSSQDTWLPFKVRTLGHKFETAFERVVAYNWSPMAGIKCVQPHCSLLVSAGQKHRTGAPRQHVDSTRRGGHTERPHQACRPLALHFTAAAHMAQPLCRDPELSLCFSNLKSENANKRQNAG